MLCDATEQNGLISEWHGTEQNEFLLLIRSFPKMWNGMKRNGTRFLGRSVNFFLFQWNGTVRKGTEQNEILGLIRACYRPVTQNGIKWSWWPVQGFYRSAERNERKRSEVWGLVGGHYHQTERNGTEWNLGLVQGLLSIGGTERNAPKRNIMKFETRWRGFTIKRNGTERTETERDFWLFPSFIFFFQWNWMEGNEIWGLFRGWYRLAARYGTVQNETEWNLSPVYGLLSFGGIERNGTNGMEWNGASLGVVIVRRNGTERNEMWDLSRGYQCSAEWNGTERNEILGLLRGCYCSA